MTTALLLNASFEPLRVIPLTRAFSLVFSGKATVVEEGETIFHSQLQEFRAPKVIRMNYMVKVPYRSRIPLTRTNLIARDKGLCGYCGVYCGAKGTIDHVHPRSKGGQHRWENTVLSCSPCNGRKDDKTLAELGWTLKVKPWAPKGTSFLIIGLHKVEEAWEPYLATA
jgi:5-methylcytosine-specific restriction endonuclease McrA